MHDHTEGSVTQWLKILQKLEKLYNAYFIYEYMGCNNTNSVTLKLSSEQIANKKTWDLCNICIL